MAPDANARLAGVDTTLPPEDGLFPPVVVDVLATAPPPALLVLPKFCATEAETKPFPSPDETLPAVVEEAIFVEEIVRLTLFSAPADVEVFSVSPLLAVSSTGAVAAVAAGAAPATVFESGAAFDAVLAGVGGVAWACEEEVLP